VSKRKTTNALKALRELQKQFQSSDVSEKDLLQASRRIRCKLVLKHYTKQG